MKTVVTSAAVNRELTARILANGNPTNVRTPRITRVKCAQAPGRSRKEAIIAVCVLAALAAAVFTAFAFGLIPSNI